MSNNFEKFIQKNRKEFDTETPSANVWANIAKTIPSSQHGKHFTLRDIYKWSAAAAVIFIALTSVYFIYIRKDSHESNVANSGQRTNPTIQNPIEMSGVAPEYAVQFKTVYESV